MVEEKCDSSLNCCLTVVQPPSKVVVKEGDDAILPCSFSSKNIRQELFDWKKNKDKKDMKEVFMYDKGKVYDKGDSRQDEQFRGRVFHFPEHLDEERRSNIELVVDPILTS
ncbi:unnamed protein product [Pleuronectes platessa]|uniref:Immunoglobulin V-set domain-containing protein n=1 Tax=Pleuronectes platessa TaxID=8262 RepID=A0A9N7UV57_PLEPL|nr:unnamed protein product [Pleuronectes platessa]